MQRKRQKACLLASLSVLTVLSTYYIATSPVEQVSKPEDSDQDLELTLKEVKPDQHTNEVAAELPTSSNNYFLVQFLERNTLRSKALEECMKTLADPSATEDEKGKAKKHMDTLNEVAAREEGLENLIRNKGYHDVMVNTHNGHVDIVIQSKTLSSTQADELLSLVKHELSVNAEDISIRNRE